MEEDIEFSSNISFFPLISTSFKSSHSLYSTHHIASCVQIPECALPPTLSHQYDSPETCFLVKDNPLLKKSYTYYEYINFLHTISPKNLFICTTEPYPLIKDLINTDNLIFISLDDEAAVIEYYQLCDFLGKVLDQWNLQNIDTLPEKTKLLIYVPFYSLDNPRFFSKLPLLNTLPADAVVTFYSHMPRLEAFNESFKKKLLFFSYEYQLKRALITIFNSQISTLLKDDKDELFKQYYPSAIAVDLFSTSSRQKALNSLSDHYLNDATRLSPQFYDSIPYEVTLQSPRMEDFIIPLEYNCVPSVDTLLISLGSISASIASKPPYRNINVYPYLPTFPDELKGTLLYLAASNRAILVGLQIPPINNSYILFIGQSKERTVEITRTLPRDVKADSSKDTVLKLLYFAPLYSVNNVLDLLFRSSSLVRNVFFAYSHQIKIESERGVHFTTKGTSSGISSRIASLLSKDSHFLKMSAAVPAEPKVSYNIAEISKPVTFALYNYIINFCDKPDSYAKSVFTDKLLPYIARPELYPLHQLSMLLAYAISSLSFFDTFKIWSLKRFLVSVCCPHMYCTEEPMRMEQFNHFPDLKFMSSVEFYQNNIEQLAAQGQINKPPPCNCYKIIDDYVTFVLDLLSEINWEIEL